MRVLMMEFPCDRRTIVVANINRNHSSCSSGCAFDRCRVGLVLPEAVGRTPAAG